MVRPLPRVSGPGGRSGPIQGRGSENTVINYPIASEYLIARSCLRAYIRAVNHNRGAVEMNTTNEFLDAVKAKHGLISDYALCKKLEVSSSRIGHYRKNRSVFDDLLAVKVANLLEIDPLYVIAAVHAESAKKESEKKVWTDILERLGGLAASVVIGLSLSALPAPQAHAGGISNHSVYIMLSRLRNRKNRWLPFFPAFPR